MRFLQIIFHHMRFLPGFVADWSEFVKIFTNAGRQAVFGDFRRRHMEPRVAKKKLPYGVPVGSPTVVGVSHH